MNNFHLRTWLFNRVVDDKITARNITMEDLGMNFLLLIILELNDYIVTDNNDIDVGILENEGLLFIYCPFIGFVVTSM